MATSTLWGMSQQSLKITRGIMWYSTASHGGYHLSKKLNEKVPVYMRNCGGWYEEDCAWSIVVTVFPQFFSEKEQALARDTFKNWYPESYEKFYGNNEKSA